MPKIVKKLVPVNNQTIIKEAIEANRMIKINSLNSFPNGNYNHTELRETYNWTSVNGTSRKVKDLSDAHIKNIISKLSGKPIFKKIKDFFELELIFRENNDESIKDYDTIATPEDFQKFFGM